MISHSKQENADLFLLIFHLESANVVVVVVVMVWVFESVKALNYYLLGPVV